LLAQTGCVAVVALAGCADADPTAGPDTVSSSEPRPAGGQQAAPGAAGPQVDTLGLRAARREAGIPGCGSISGDSGGTGGTTDSGTDETTPTPAPDGLPDVTLPCLGGGTDVALASLRGPLVVNFWASWCEPCRAELSYFAELDRAGVDVLGVNVQEPQPDRALVLAADSGVRYPSVADVDSLLRAPLRLSALPTTLLVDEDGAVVATLVQEFGSYEELVEAVEDNLGVRA